MEQSGVFWAGWPVVILNQFLRSSWSFHLRRDRSFTLTSVGFWVHCNGQTSHSWWLWSEVIIRFCRESQLGFSPLLAKILALRWNTETEQRDRRSAKLIVICTWSHGLLYYNKIKSVFEWIWVYHLPFKRGFYLVVDWHQTYLHTHAHTKFFFPEMMEIHSRSWWFSYTLFWVWSVTEHRSRSLMKQFKLNTSSVKNS